MVAFLAAAVLATWSTPEATPIFNPDSIEYITSAENLVAGEGLRIIRSAKSKACKNPSPTNRKRLYTNAFP